ncbi:MAG: S-layer homology domain-containing protein [Clostridia bacterium]|nr:S-layer homology domain-containing protein [Clostridia bacterium]
MKHKTTPLVLLLTLTLFLTPAAAWSPSDFSGGALSGLVAEEGALLVSDTYNNVIWRIHPDGSVERAAGQIGIADVNGEPIGKYDDGTLASALFMEPWAVAPFLDNGYAVTDTDAHVVRWFDQEGVYTAAGSGKPGSANGVGTEAAFNQPTGLAAGKDGRLYIADTGNGAIRVMNADGEVGTLLTGLVDPTGLCWHDDALYIAETGRNRILRLKNGRQEVLAGGGEEEADGHYPGAWVDGPAAVARFDHPQGLAVANDGTLYVADTGNGAIRKLKDGRVTTLPTSEHTSQAPVRPRSILVQGNRLLVTDLIAQNVLTVELTPVTFTDVAPGAWYAQAVTAAVERGITVGTGGGSFSPDVPLTRASFAVMLTRLHLHSDGNAVIGGEAAFPDVADDTWYAPAVRWAADRGIITGYDTGAFGPEDTITREQLAAMLWRYAGSPAPAGSELTCSDADLVDAWAVDALLWAQENGVMQGGDGGRFDPKANASRAQVAQMLLNYLEMTWQS